MNGEKILDISWGTLLKAGVAFLIFYIIYLIKDILIWFIFALVISVLFSPAVDLLKKRRIPHSLAVLFVYIGFFGLLGVVIYFSIGIFSFKPQLESLIFLFSEYFKNISHPLQELGMEGLDSFDVFTQRFQEWLARASDDVFSVMVSIFGGIFATITISTLALFLSLEEKGMERAIRVLFPKRQEEEALAIWRSCQLKVSGWFGARLLACLFVGVMSYVSLRLFNIDYPFILALFAGVTNIIPIIGPIIAGVVIALIAALDSVGIAVVILFVFFIIQQIEGNILTPILTRRFVGLPPALVLISLLIGGKLWGILGAILAIPLAGIIFEFTRDFLKKRKEGEIPPSSPPPSVGQKRSIIW